MKPKEVNSDLYPLLALYLSCPAGAIQNTTLLYEKAKNEPAPAARTGQDRIGTSPDLIEIWRGVFRSSESGLPSAEKAAAGTWMIAIVSVPVLRNH